VIAEAVVERLLVVVEDLVDAQLVDDVGESRQGQQQEGEQECQAKA
jgi:hypothetical protein